MNKLLIVVIIAVIVLVGAYFIYFSKPKEQTPTPSTISETDTIENITGSDTVSTLEQEISDTELENLDKEFADIEAEIEAALTE